MKIYFGASVSLDRSRLPLYQEIVDQLKKQGHEVLSEHVVDPALEIGEGMPAQEVFERETQKIQSADLMIAEVSLPSWGTAFLMEHALDENVPVLALSYKDANHELPTMVQGHPELYVEHYNRSNLKTVIKRNLKYFVQRNRSEGKMVVIDGADGAGKATQTELLINYLQDNGVRSKYISFPRYKTSFHGKHVGKFLAGEFGGEVSPFLSSLSFALDRLSARDEMVEWLEQGNLVIADRYVSASMAHQASKLSKNKHEDFINWIYDMEYKEHKLPKEDVVIFLDVPTDVSQKLLERQAKETGQEKDTAEADVEHQKKSLEMYRALVKRFKHWHQIDCTKDGELLSREEIHQQILDLLRQEKVIE